MYQDNETNGLAANRTISQTVFDKRALATSDLSCLAISLSNMHYLSLQFPSRLADLLLSNGCLELLIRKTKMLATKSEPKAEIAFSSALATIASAAAAGTSKLRCRIVQAKLIPIFLPILQGACLVLDQVHRRTGKSKESIHLSDDDDNESELGLTCATQECLDPAVVQIVHQRQSSSISCFDESFEETEIRPVRVSDLIMITKLVAYVSKYESTRSYLREKYSLFFFIEHLTVTAVIPEIRHWASSCMKNATRTTDANKEKRCGLVTCKNLSSSETMICCDKCKITPYCRYLRSINISVACKEYSWRLHQHWCEIPH